MNTFYSNLLESIEVPLGNKTILKSFSDFSDYKKYPDIEEKMKLYSIPNVSDVKHVVDSYTRGSDIVNQTLWKAKGNFKQLENQHMLKYAIGINKILNSAKPLDEDLIVYTGMRRNPLKFSQDGDGLIHFPSFISTSHNPHVGLQFARHSKQNIILKNGDEVETNVRHLMKINLRKWQSVGAYIGEDSLKPHENEYLIKANQVLHIHRDYDEHYHRNIFGKLKGITRVYHAVILNDDEKNKLSNHSEIISYNDFKKIL